jgi:hypothetical protein
MISVGEIKSAVCDEFSSMQVYFSPEEIPVEVNVPESWIDFGIGGDVKFPKSWFAFSNKMPWVCKLLEKCLLGTAVVYDGEAFLVYIFHGDSSLYYYVGRRPVSKCEGRYYKVSGFPPSVGGFLYRGS